MPPSSLIFLVIIAIWAAYFLQHWVRRREHLATARSVDRFSESMRVLERRSPLPEANLSTPQPRSYAVSPARPARPEVLVKRAAPLAPEAPAETVLSAPGAAHGRPAVRSDRRVRGLALLGAVAALLVVVPLVALGVVAWPVVLAPVAATAGVLVWLRRSAETERAARRATTPARTTDVPAQREQTRVSRATDVHASHPAPARDADGAGDGHVGGEAGEALYDIQAVEREAAQPAAVAAVASRPAGPAVPLVDEDDIPLTWDPVPVPRPTYTMKAMAQRPAPAPVGQGVPPELAEPAYEEPVRRVAGA
ncbi:MAG TPA: hypothetical protein VH915_04580 [Pedococcus sp.]